MCIYTCTFFGLCFGELCELRAPSFGVIYGYIYSYNLLLYIYLLVLNISENHPCVSRTSGSQEGDLQRKAGVGARDGLGRA